MRSTLKHLKLFKMLYKSLANINHSKYTLIGLENSSLSANNYSEAKLRRHSIVPHYAEGNHT